ncbi:MAG TPA: hypothetical protein DCP53_02480 [Elusimicrobia bacterium]|nr:MAG: hypothetical protein A2551_06535 [Elusimicrobia bacterium RIFOXYD2_FULL_34_30]HAM38255.1 hypothetical protein [Elusimicrobiota bacterium]
MNILFINPGITAMQKDAPPVIPPLGLAYIATISKKNGHKVLIYDCVLEGAKNPIPVKENESNMLCYSVTDDNLLNILSKFKPDIIAISNNFTVTEKEVIRLSTLFKNFNRNIKVFVGGINCTARYNQLIQHSDIDILFIGEGEESFSEILNRIEKNRDYNNIEGICYRKNGQIIRTNPAYVKNIDSLPVLDWDLLYLERYLEFQQFIHGIKKRAIGMVTSRGCIYECVFCSSKRILGHWRGRSPSSVIEEAKFLVEKHKIQEIQFYDANIAINRARFKELMNLWIKHINIPWSAVGGIQVTHIDDELLYLMKKSKCHTLVISVEHVEPQLQEFIGKKVPLDKVLQICKTCKKLGIWIHCSFVIGFPNETIQQAEKCLNFAKKANFDSISVFAATPLPGSRLFDIIAPLKKIDPLSVRLLSDDFLCVKESDIEAFRNLKKNMQKRFLISKIIKECNPISIFQRIISFRMTNFITIIFRVFKRYCVLQK